MVYGPTRRSRPVGLYEPCPLLEWNGLLCWNKYVSCALLWKYKINTLATYIFVVVLMYSDDVANYDIVVIGAGLIGMATAQELITRHPSLTYCVVEKENRVGLLSY